MAEVENLIRTKLYMPRVASRLVDRPVLIERLNRGLQRKGTFILAPAGYGKSTLAVAWLSQLSVPVAWLSLDEQDSDLATFVNYLIEAIQTVFPGACSRTASFLNASQLPPADYLAVNLIDELSDLPGAVDSMTSDRQTIFVLAIDDYHFIGKPDVHAFVRRLLTYLPSGIHLVLISRKDPAYLPLTKLRAQQEILEVRLRDLRFDVKETETFLSQVAGLTIPPDAIRLLASKTEGWILGLRLASLSLRDLADPTAFIHELQGTNRYVMEYLLEEVLSSQDQSIQEFLLKTAILDRLSSRLCEAVAGPDNPTLTGATYMDWLEHVNLFVINLDQERQWYRFHHLFRDLLLHKLKSEYSVEEIAELHRRASRWLSDHGELEAALTHALEANDMELAAGVVESRQSELMRRENWPLLSRLLNRLPPSLVAHRPMLLVAKAMERRAVGDYQVVDNLLDEAEALLDGEPGPLAEPAVAELYGEIAWVRAFQAWYSGNFEQAIALCGLANESLPDDHPTRATVRQTEALALQGSGRLDRAAMLVRQALKDSLEQPGTTVETDWYSLFLVYYLAGECDQAERIAQQFVTLYRDQSANPVLNVAYYVLGSTHYERNAIEEAQHYFDLVISRLVYDLTYQDGFICLAICHQLLGQPDRANQMLDELEGFVHSTRRAHLLSALGATRARIALMTGNVEEASRWANSAALGPPSIHRIYVNDPHLIQVQAWIAQATNESLVQAQKGLQALQAAAEKAHSVKRMVEALTGRALVCSGQGDRVLALETLEQALLLAEPRGYLRTFVDFGPALAKLLQDMQPADRKVARYRQELLSAFGPQAPDSLSPTDQQSLPVHLTPRELDVMALLAQRRSYKEIATELVIAPKTVKSHVSNIYQKLDVNRRAQAVARARALNLLP